MKVALAQIDTTVGDFPGNIDRIVRMARRAAEGGARLAVFQELAVPGYPPRDLLEKPSFYRGTREAEERLARETAGLDLKIVYGTVAPTNSDAGKPAYNQAVVVERGRELFRQTKMLLPTYDVFDEARYFQPAASQQVWEADGVKFALTVCEDAWNDKQFWRRRRYDRDPVEELARDGAEALISINASPFHMGKRELRREIFATTARKYRMPVIYVNQVGGNDELIFDGSSFVMDAEGRVIAAATSFAEDLIFADLEAGAGDNHANLPEETEAVYEALVLGARDYIHKCGFREVLLGLSGGIDSSVTAVIAADAVGKQNVTGVAMPGPFSSEASLEDARALARNLGIRFEVASINGPYRACLEALQPLFGDRPPDVTEENIQARLRGLVLMALSNKWGAMVVTTGNKSELAVGYCTLYGDMAGGLAVISDVPKTMVYELGRIANRRHGGVIPERVFVKPPSAELRPDQKDSDSLPAYEMLDAILHRYIEEYKSAEEIAAETGFAMDVIQEVIRMVDRNEYKRQQAPPGLKVTSKAFGIGRRFPIAQRFTP